MAETYVDWVKTRQCGSKIRWQSQMLADNMLTLLTWNDASFGQLEVYHCPWPESDGTRHWHLGHPSKGFVAIIKDEEDT